jgi:hypothetical protein
MGFNDRMIFFPPEEEQIDFKKEPVEGQVCPQCGSDQIATYPVACSRGARVVVKCQACYHRLSVERPRLEDEWPPFRAAAYDWPLPERQGGARPRP